MKKREERKNKKLSYKFSSHNVNLLSLVPGSMEFQREKKKAHRAGLRFSNYIKKTTQGE
jgi:hypothetical protein